MKKRLFALLTAFLCVCCPLTAYAVDVIIDIEENGSGIVITSDDFIYKTNEIYGDKSGFFLESELDDPDFMVVGYVYYENCPEDPFDYVVSPVNNTNTLRTGIGIMYNQIVIRELGDCKLRIGDFLKIDGGIMRSESSLVTYFPLEEGTMSYLGNGVDIFGEEFKAVIRLQMVIDQMAIEHMKTEEGLIDDIELIQGDVTIDDSVNILDCIVINKHLLTGTELCDYAKYVGDIDANGKLDFTDSLAILKESVGITVDFQ